MKTFQTFLMLVLALGAALTCCSCSKQIQMSMYHNKDYPDGSYDFAVTTFFGSDSISFGTSHITNLTLTYIGKDGDTLRSELWIPVGTRHDTNSLLVLIPGYGEHTYALYPFALSATRAGFSVAFISARGLDLNEHLRRDFILRNCRICLPLSTNMPKMRILVT